MTRLRVCPSIWTVTVLVCSSQSTCAPRFSAIKRIGTITLLLISTGGTSIGLGLLFTLALGVLTFLNGYFGKKHRVCAVISQVLSRN